MSVNKAFILGRVGKDPQVSHISDTKKVAFTMATTDRGYTKQDGTQVPDRTEWHNIVVWRGLAEVCEKYVHKGDMLYIEGKITTRSWDGQDGQKHYITEIVAEVVELFPKSQPAASPYPQAPEAQTTGGNLWDEPKNDNQPF